MNSFVRNVIYQTNITSVSKSDSSFITDIQRLFEHWKGSVNAGSAAFPFM